MELSLRENATVLVPALPGEIRWWEWPTVLSLDAPLVAVCWQAMFARMAGTRVQAGEMALLFATVWLIYAADRWIDGWRLRDQASAAARHRFYARHRWRILPLWLGLFAASAVEVWRLLTSSQIWAGLGLAAVAGGYVFIHQGLQRERLSSLPKEALAALIFACGSALCPGLVALGRHVPGFLPAVALFACLCFANLVLIASWEKEVDRAQGSPSLPQRWPAAGLVARLLAAIVMAQSLVYFVCTHGGAHGTFVALSLAALLLLAVDLCEPRIGRRAARVFADAVLLVPLLVFLFF